MKAIGSIWILVFLLSIHIVQAQPQSNYDVHREYDVQGNLIYYDSSVVTTWQSDTLWAEGDSLISVWHAHPDSVLKWHNGRRQLELEDMFPEDYILRTPSFNWEVPQQEITDIINELNERISRFNIDSHLQEMEDLFRDLQQEIEREFIDKGLAPTPDTSTPQLRVDAPAFEGETLEL